MGHSGGSYLFKKEAGLVVGECPTSVPLGTRAASV
jgi:hypothetical protein